MPVRNVLANRIEGVEDIKDIITKAQQTGK